LLSLNPTDILTISHHQNLTQGFIEQPLPERVDGELHASLLHRFQLEALFLNFLQSSKFLF